MKRRDFMTAALASGFAADAALGSTAHTTPRPRAASSDRAYMVDLLGKMAKPVLGPMANGQLHARFHPELSPTWDGRHPGVAYLECFGRLMAGIA
jgi:hypothetical protein